MKYLTDGRVVVTALILLLLFFSGLLYLYANAGPKTGTNKVVGQLKTKQLKILRKLDSEVIWEELDESDPIRSDTGTQSARKKAPKQYYFLLMEKIPQRSEWTKEV
ncbi:hypothetical protein [Leptospira sp. B5-022]|uniref:hypothetical protein n=1 Tax=Leptospira sp. B5-022 TaxID=1242992 RepID=UPI0002BD46D8|nr:hypothetical protein [Leptospira sp. B5-022]EMK01722.1 hypothetical protein LEP1GSC192_1368 [Leptospira sp. B5-022]